MKLHRFYVGDKLEMTRNLWLHDAGLVHQISRVLRLRPNEQLVLFDGLKHDRMYKILEIKSDVVHLEHITDMARKVPPKNIYLLWALLKKDKNDWVIQKCTELGVSNFVPIVTERTEKMGFDTQRATKIAIEAAEQCGRSDVPSVREPIKLETALEEFDGKVPLLVCQQGVSSTNADLNNIALLVGPEGGWSDSELLMFENKQVAPISLHDFTLRAETACVAAVAKLVQ
jgi:16S rRNA (uracil1498-N3)-methyltransferase